MIAKWRKTHKISSDISLGEMRGRHVGLADIYRGPVSKDANGAGREQKKKKKKKKDFRPTYPNFFWHVTGTTQFFFVALEASSECFDPNLSYYGSIFLRIFLL